MANIGYAEMVTYSAQVLTPNDSVLKFTDSLFVIYFCIDRTEVDKEAGGYDS